MKGAAVFLIVFLAMLLLTLAVPEIPPGKFIYDAIVDVETDYPILGVPATTLVAAIFNGAIYGVIVWLIYDLFIAKKVKEVPAKSEEKPGQGPST